MSRPRILNEPLQVSFWMLVDSTNVVFVIYTTYHIGVTKFGDYRSLQFVPWSLPAIALLALFLKLLCSTSTHIGSIF
ncbi:hypothetical protein EDB89DRAFT_1918669, partial [Lactarius sanguifluus]